MNSKIVLLLSDNPKNRIQIQKYLNSWKIEYSDCFDSYKGMENIELIIIDDTNCRMNGLKQIEHICQNKIYPIIYISNQTRKSLRPYLEQFHFKLIEPNSNCLEEIKPEIESIGMNNNRKTLNLINTEKSICFKQKEEYLYFDSSKIRLTKSEQKVLCRLAKEQGKVVSRKDLMMILWQTDEFISEGTLTTCISRLRAKMLKAFEIDPILTKKGKGYSLSSDIGLLKVRHN